MGGWVGGWIGWWVDGWIDRKWRLGICTKFIAWKQDRRYTPSGVRVTIVDVEKQCVKCYENVCVCVCLFLPQLSGRQVAASLRRVILSSVACLAVENFSTLSHKRQDFRNKEVVERKVCVLIFATMFV
jgi:hypothetical protein